MTHLNGGRKWVIGLLWAVLVVVIFGIGFGPQYVAARNDAADLALMCHNARANIAELEASKLDLRADALIAHDLALPIAEELDHFVRDFRVPTLPVECVEP